MKHSIKTSFFAIFLSFLYTLSSCTQTDTLGNYSKEDLFIETQKDSRLDTSKYEIVDIISLKVPKSISAIKASQIKWTNNYIYILDSDYNQSLFAFEDNGNYIGRYGQKGHAKNEFIEKPTSFTIDKTTGDIHIYERASVKIIIFSSNGAVKRTINLRPFVPGAIELTDDGNYLFCFEGKINGHGDKLAIYNENVELVKSLMKFSNDGYLSLLGPSFFKDHNVIYNPLLSDSLMVISADTVRSVIKFKFDCEFNTKEIMNKCFAEGSYLPLFKLKNGVQFIDNVEMTDSIIHVSYAYNQNRCNFVKNLTNGKVYNGLHGTLFAGITPCSDFTIKDNKLVYFIAEDDVDLVRTNIMSDPDNWEMSRKETPKKMLDIIDKKIPTPIILTVKLK